MTVWVGYAPTPEGRAALEHALAECTTREVGLVVVLAEPVVDQAAHLSAAEASLGPGRLQTRATDDAEGVAAELIDASYDNDTDLVVIGVRRRSPVGKALLGSTAQRVLLEAQCPVMAVKSPVTPQA